MNLQGVRGGQKARFLSESDVKSSQVNPGVKAFLNVAASVCSGHSASLPRQRSRFRRRSDLAGLGWAYLRRGYRETVSIQPAQLPGCVQPSSETFYGTYHVLIICTISVISAVIVTMQKFRRCRTA